MDTTNIDRSTTHPVGYWVVLAVAVALVIGGWLGERAGLSAGITTICTFVGAGLCVAAHFVFGRRTS